VVPLGVNVTKSEVDYWEDEIDQRQAKPVLAKHVSISVLASSYYANTDESSTPFLIPYTSVRTYVFGDTTKIIVI